MYYKTLPIRLGEKYPNLIVDAKISGHEFVKLMLQNSQDPDLQLLDTLNIMWTYRYPDLL
jgi:hypothetical protein